MSKTYQPDFDKPTAYVIGGSRGIGLEVGKLLSQRYRVVLFARDEARLKQAAGDWASYYPMDVLDEEQIATAFAAAREAVGAPSLICYFAGRAIPGTFAEMSLQAFEASMEVNFMGLVRCMHYGLPLLRDGGKLLITSSMAGFLPVYGYSDYAASKYAVMGYAQVLAQELLSRSITVSVLCPPDTDTEGFARENRTKPFETQAISQGARLLSPAYVARVAVRGLEKGKAIIVPGFSAKLIYCFSRIAPQLFQRICFHIIKKTQKK